jgi:hypothetical protein
MVNIVNKNVISISTVEREKSLEVVKYWTGIEVHNKFISFGHFSPVSVEWSSMVRKFAKNKTVLKF